MSKTLEQKVVSNAIALAKNKKKIGGGICWEFVRSVLSSSGALRDCDLKKADAKFTVQTPWGTPDNDFIPGYVMVLQNATITQKKTDSNGSTISRLKIPDAHVVIIADVAPGNVVTIIHQNAPPDSVPHGTRFAMEELSGKWWTYAPIAKK